MVGDKKIVTGALKNGHFGIIDSANRIIKHPFDYPFPYSGVEGIYRSIVFYSLLKPNNRQRKFALSILWSDIFEIYQVNDTNVTRTFLSSFNHIPKVRERQGGRLPSHTPDYDNNIVGLDKMAVSENLICFVYSSEGYEKWKKLVDASNEILCFDWNGNKVKKYVLPFPIHRFCIDDKHIYGLRYFSDSETIIYRFNMDL